MRFTHAPNIIPNNLWTTYGSFTFSNLCNSGLQRKKFFFNNSIDALDALSRRTRFEEVSSQENRIKSSSAFNVVSPLSEFPFSK